MANKTNTSDVVKVRKNPQVPPTATLVPQSILDGIITLYVWNNQTINTESAVSGVAQDLEDKGFEHGIYTGVYARLMYYVSYIEFNWPEDDETPEQYLDFERWWLESLSSSDHIVNYTGFSKRLPLVLMNEVRNAISRAHVIWKPRREKNPLNDKSALDENGNVDPNV